MEGKGVIYSKIEVGLTALPPSPKPPAAKFTSQDDPHVRDKQLTDAQIKFLHYPL